MTDPADPACEGVLARRVRQGRPREEYGIDPEAVRRELKDYIDQLGLAPE